VGIPELKHGDGLIVYAATRGIKAFCEVVGEVRRPKDKQEAPWAGGVFRYGFIFPFRVVMEFDQPISTRFSSQKLQGTSITTSQLRRGFSSINTEDGKYLLSTLSTKKKD